MSRQITLTAVVAALVMVKFVYLPFQEELASLRNELTQKHERLSKKEAIAEALPLWQEQDEKLNHELSKLEDVFPNYPDAGMAKLQFQLTLQKLAREQDMRLDSVEWLAISPGQPESAVVSVSFEGKFTDLARFHLALAEVGPWLAVDNLDFRVREQKMKWKRPGTARGEILLKIYYIVGGGV
ncbi:type 4a pilus biogenesis protein PilO [Lacimicrobium sp. SS2-24]|uniref:type 4a pilus biogenesis protein PilO n=1 Tax=Lacimicrobium sp. SS2-24 TaxID=2005569 RepID=UPI000B4AE71D|nr:type 4a pilus biogenesis protein PilO [Lacimicrobium sp. SS2-24]